jgi:hypothetical protein
MSELSPQFHAVDQYMGHAASGQNSTTWRSGLRSFLAFLDQHYHHGMANNAYEETIRFCITRMLANCQLEVTTEYEHIWDNNTDLQGIFGESRTPSHQ